MLFYLLSADELGELFERLGYDFDDGHDPAQRSSTTSSRDLARLDAEPRGALRGCSRAPIASRSWELFLEALDSDVADIQGGTTEEGIHLGAMAGTVDLVQRCYTGLEIRDDVPPAEPAAADGARRLAFTILYRGQLVDLEFEDESVTVTSQTAEAAAISVGIGATVTDLQASSRLQLHARAAPAS